MPATRYCSFCEKSEHEVKKLIAKEPHYICDECVELCVDILDTSKVEQRRRTFIADYVLARAGVVIHPAGLDGSLSAKEAAKVWDEYLAPSKPTGKAQLKVTKS